jgi:hypothetical protein
MFNLGHFKFYMFKLYGVEAAYAPGLWLDPAGDSTSYSSTVVHCVQSLYENRFVYSNKSVLS